MRYAKNMRMTWLKLLNYFHLSRESLGEMALNMLSFFYVKIYLIVLLALNLLNWLTAFIINKNVSQDLVFLHYNVTFGVNLIGSVKKVYIIPLLGFAIILINFVLLIFIHKQGKFIIHLLLFTALLANLFLLAAVISVYLINFR